MIPKLETSPERPSSLRRAAALGQVFLLSNKDSAASEERLPRWWADQQATFGATDLIKQHYINKKFITQILFSMLFSDMLDMFNEIQH